MQNSNSIIEIIKQAASEAAEASQPCDIVFGTITSLSPLKILVEQKLILGNNQLIFTACSRQTINSMTLPGGKIIMLKQRGGQKYLILDSVG